MGAQRQRPFLLKRSPRRRSRGTKTHGYLMIAQIIMARSENVGRSSAIPLNSWGRAWGGAEGMWHGLHQKAIPAIVRGRSGGQVPAPLGAELPGAGRGGGVGPRTLCA